MKDVAASAEVLLRQPEQVMRRRRMGAAFPTRLSFLAVLLRALTEGKVAVSRPVWAMDYARLHNLIAHTWIRITLAQGASLFDELSAADDGWLPVAGF